MDTYLIIYFYSVQVEPRSSQSKELKTDTCRFLASHSELLGQGKEWLGLCEDNVTEWDRFKYLLWASITTQAPSVLLSQPSIN